MAECLEEKTDVAYYDKNRTRLYEALTGYGYTCIKPEGAFYMWVKSPDEDEDRFVEQAKKYHLIPCKGRRILLAGLCADRLLCVLRHDRAFPAGV